MKRISLLLPLVVVGALVLAGCNGGSSAGNGTLSVAMTDAPACGFDHVYVTVDRVRVNASSTANDSSGGWHEVVLASPQKIDLLSLTNGVLTQLGQTGLPAGHYEQVRLVLAPNTGGALNNSVVPTGGVEQALSTPSSTQSGYKVIGDFTVTADQIVDLVLDFDACHSIVQKGNGGYALKPVVTATVQAISGRIEGYVDTSDAGAFVFAEQNGHIVKGTVADSAGHFVLSPVVQSSTNGNYDVVMAKTGDASTIVRGVTVVASATTTLSTSGQPFLLAPSPTHSASGTVSPASVDATVDALQASSGGSYVIASTNADGTTGAYSLTLPNSAPMIGDYTGTLPVALVGDTTAEGLYTVRATTALGVSQSQNVNLLSADATGIDFLF